MPDFIGPVHDDGESARGENSPKQSGVAKGDAVGRHGGAGEFRHPALRMSVVGADRDELSERDKDRYEAEAAISCGEAR